MFVFKARLTRPEKGNKYYMTISSGGYSRAIKGKPTDSQCDVLSNCVGYAYGRFHEICACTTMNLFDPVNAENIFQNAIQHGRKVGTTPKLGAAIVWQQGATLTSSDGAGHIAIVEKINEDGSIVISESGWNCTNPFWTSTLKPPYAYGNGYKLLGFIYQDEEVPKVETPKEIIKFGDKGEAVRWMQTKLFEHGFLRKNEIDGDFGRITLGALLAFQVQSGLIGDCGDITKDALNGKVVT